MLSFSEALADDYHPAVCAGEGQDEDADFLLGWDVEFFFPELELRPELRLCCGTRPDVVLHCKSGRAVKAHRDVLAEVEYFRSMLAGGGEGREAASLSFDEDAESVFEVLRWVYCRDATMDKDLALDVLRLAELYEMDSLADHCARALAGAPAAGGGPTAGDNGSSTASGQHSTKDTDCGDSSCGEMLSGGSDERDVAGGGGSGEHAATAQAATSAAPAAVRGSRNKEEISQLLAEAVALVEGDATASSAAAAAAPPTAASSSAADSKPPRPVKLKDL